MKRSIGILLALFMLITCIPVAAAADISLPTEQVIYYADGSYASCTAANCTVSTFDSTWYVISKSASRSGNTAAASVTMGKSQLGVTTKTASCSLSLSCDANGNLS